ncbi:MAG: hypothetical protein NZ578_00705 [Candidatus Binatia bacterium]|nr:hypothetical protein [Candidatus Binatia bacterium]
MSEKQLLRQGQILTGSLFSEPMREETVHVSGPEFLRLANALFALYPKGSEEKRLLDASKRVTDARKIEYRTTP